MLATSSWYDRHVSEVSSATGKPYLQYTQAKQTSIFNNTNAIRSVLAAQQSEFAKRFNERQTTPTSYSFQEIDQLMSDWVSGNTVGSKIDDAMQRICNFDKFGHPDQYGTSAGIKISGTNIPLSQALSNFGYSRKKAITQISQICNTVDSAVNNIIAFLAQNQEPLLVEAIANCYYGGMDNLPPSLAAKIPANTSIKQGLIKESDTKVVATMASLRQEVNRLQSLGGSGGDGAKDTYDSAVRAIQAAFNSIGGTIHEVAIAHALCSALGIGNGAIKKTNAQIQKIVEAGGGRFYAQHVGEEHLEGGSEGKDDVEITWNEGKMILRFGGSIKLRQGRGFRGSGANSKALGVSGFVAREASTFGEIEGRLGSGLSQYAYSVVAATAVNADTTAWNQLKQYIGALLLVDALSGLGGSGDFSTLLIVNNKIFSIADILKKVISQVETSFAAGGTKSYFLEGMNIYSLKDQVDDARERTVVPRGKNYKTEQAKVRNRQAYLLLAREKISITLNLGNLYGSDVFIR